MSCTGTAPRGAEPLQFDGHLTVLKNWCFYLPARVDGGGTNDRSL
jgi:hypothetical protein